MKYTVDPDGGFYGTVMNDGRAVPTDKGSILHARILWTFSRAYRRYGLPVYQEMADRAIKHLILYCDDDWNIVDTDDSYGHDIETSWLLCESAEAVGDEALVEKIRKQAVEMVDVALAEGMNADGAMKLEGPRPAFQWWPECETVIGCINAWQITGKKKYFDAAVRNWDFTRRHFIDPVNGGWFKELDETYLPSPTSPKASTWNCPYHNARMGYEIVARLAHPAVHTEVMTWSNITGVRGGGELIDFESMLRVWIPGGDIESSGREKQNCIQYKREDFTQTTVTPMRKGVTFTLTFLPKLNKGDKTDFAAVMKVSGVQHRETAHIDLDAANPGRLFTGFGGNFCIQNVQKNPEVIDYCLENLRVAFGRVEFPWGQWDMFTHSERYEGQPSGGGGGLGWGAPGDHIRRSAEMARRLKQVGMPIIVSAWFPPMWAGNLTTRSDGTSRAYSLKHE